MTFERERKLEFFTQLFSATSNSQVSVGHTKLRVPRERVCPTREFSRSYFSICIIAQGWRQQSPSNVEPVGVFIVEAVRVVHGERHVFKPNVN